jgi:hypothetical protein
MELAEENAHVDKGQMMLHYIQLKGAYWPSGWSLRFPASGSGLTPTQWTSMYVLVGGSWLSKLLRPPGLVVTIGRWKNGPTYAE